MSLGVERRASAWRSFDGLEPGERVVTSGNFLIAAESRLRVGAGAAVVIARAIAACAAQPRADPAVSSPRSRWGGYALAARRSTPSPTSPTCRSSSSPSGRGRARTSSRTRSPTRLVDAARGAAGALRARPVVVRDVVRLRRSSRTAPTCTGRAAACSSTMTRRGRGCPRRDADARPRRHRRRLGVPVRAGRPERPPRPRRAAQPAGLEPPLRARERARRRRGRLGRRLRASSTRSSSTRRSCARSAIPLQRRGERGPRRRTRRSAAACSRSPSTSTGARPRLRARARRDLEQAPLRADASGHAGARRDVAAVRLRARRRAAGSASSTARARRSAASSSCATARTRCGDRRGQGAPRRACARACPRASSWSPPTTARS